MSVPRSGLLAAWANAFIAGRTSLDQAIDAADEAVSLGEVLLAWRRGESPVRAVLPVPVGLATERF